MPLHVSSTCAHHQEVKIALHSLWYHHIYRCDDTRGCVMQFWSPDDEHMCSKHVETWTKLTVKQKFCASCWLITEINILRCTVSKTSEYSKNVSWLVSKFDALQYFNTKRISLKVKTYSSFAGAVQAELTHLWSYFWYTHTIFCRKYINYLAAEHPYGNVTGFYC